MFAKLLVLFTVIPLIELALLIKIGSYFGVIPTVILVAITGVVGVTLARNQGFIVINKIKESIEIGKMPTNNLIEGLLILVGGVMLLTPGILTDTAGFIFIIPGSRKIIRELLKNKFKDYIDNNSGFHFYS